MAHVIFKSDEELLEAPTKVVMAVQLREQQPPVPEGVDLGPILEAAWKNLGMVIATNASRDQVYGLLSFRYPDGAKDYSELELGFFYVLPEMRDGVLSQALLHRLAKYYDILKTGKANFVLTDQQSALRAYYESVVSLTQEGPFEDQVDEWGDGDEAKVSVRCASFSVAMADLLNATREEARNLPSDVDLVLKKAPVPDNSPFWRLLWIMECARPRYDRMDRDDLGRYIS